MAGNSFNGQCRNILATTIAITLIFTVLIGLTIAGATNSKTLQSETVKNSDLNPTDILDRTEEESVSIVKRTAQSIRQRQRQLGGFGGKASFSLPDIVNNEYTAELWNGTWVSDVEFAYRNRIGDLALLRFVPISVKPIVCGLFRP